MATIYNSDNFDLSNWNIALPVDAYGGTSGNDSVTISTLTNFTSPYFYANSDGSMTFAAPVAGATTRSSYGTRSELRELNPDGSLAAWKLSQGGTMSATLEIDKLPTLLDGSQGKIIIGQIHGKSQELVRLYCDAGKIYFKNDNPASNYSSQSFQLTDAAGNRPVIGLNEKFSYSIDAHGSTLTVRVYIGSKVYSSVTNIDPEWQTDTLYFKAGVYNGNTAIPGVDLIQATGAGQTTFYGLDMSHRAGEGFGGLAANAPVAQIDSFSGQANAIVTGNLLNDNGHGKDTGPAGDTLSIAAGTIKTANGGTVVQQADGTFTYTPAANFSGTDSFSYILKDSSGMRATGTANVTVTAVAGGGATTPPPVTSQPIVEGTAGNDKLNAYKKTSTTLNGGAGNDYISGHDGNDVLNGGDGNDSLYGYWGNDTLAGGKGSDILAGGPGMNTFVFKLADLGTGVDKISDFSASKGDKIDISNMLQDHYTTQTDLSRFIKIVTSGFNSVLSVDLGGTGTNWAEVAVITGVTGLNVQQLVNNGNLILPAPVFPPVAATDDFTGQQNQTVSGNLMADNGHGVDTDPNGLALSVAVATVTSTHGGTAVLQADGAFTYTPAANFSGTDSFTYTLKDSSGLTATGTANVTVASSGTTVPPPAAGLTVEGTAGNDKLNADQKIGTLINGKTGDDYLIGHDGKDILNGGDGKDLIYGYWGNDILNGGAGSDTLSGGPGADTYVFNAADLGTGVDKIVDFSASTGDKIDISDILSGYYNSVTDALANFVKITSSGGNSVLNVDTSGSCGAHGWTVVATISGVTSLDVNTLAHNGSLIV